MQGFEVLRKLADGSAAEVFLVRETSSQARVILEVLRPELMNDTELYGRFLDETKERQGLAHPNLLQLRTAGCAEDGRIFVVTEPVEDEHLGSWLLRSGPLSPSKLVEIMLPVCDALAYLHGRKLVHGYLRPSNVFLCGFPPVPKLMDTGLQLFRSKRSVAQPSSRVLVEPEYLSPERIRGNRGTITSDIYGLGVLMYELLTGRPPFTSADPAQTRQMQLEMEPPPLPAACERLAPIVMRCLSKDPSGRFPDVAEVRQALAWHAGDAQGPSTVQIHTPVVSREAIPSATRAEGPTPDPAGEVLGSYELIRLLGQGGMGHVYQARHVKLDRRVAIKVLKPELSKDVSQLQRFFQEARAVNKVNHEHIVEVVDFVEEPPAEGGRVYCVMELLEGLSLRDLARQGPVPVARALAICRQVCDALQAAHEVGVVHRDIKPDNIFLIEKGGKQDFVKVLDFGVAKLKSASEADSVGFTRSGVVVGTPAYMAPEQALGESVGPAADIYALASVLYGLLMGHPPFDSTTIGVLVTRLVTQPAPPLLPKSTGGEPIALGLRRLIERCLVKSPTERPKSMAELSAALARFEMAAEEPTTANLPAAVPPRPPQRRLLWVVAALGAAALLGLGVWLGQRRPAATPAPAAPPAAAAAQAPPTIEPAKQAPPPPAAPSSAPTPPARKHRSR